MDPSSASPPRHPLASCRAGMLLTSDALGRWTASSASKVAPGVGKVRCAGAGGCGGE